MRQRSTSEWYQALGANLGQILYMSSRDNIVSASLALRSVTYSSVLHEPNGRAKQGHRIIWNIKRQTVPVCVSEVASSVHGTHPQCFTAKPPGKMSKGRWLCLSAPNNATGRTGIVGAVEPECSARLALRPRTSSRKTGTPGPTTQLYARASRLGSARATQISGLCLLCSHALEPRLPPRTRLLHPPSEIGSHWLMGFQVAVCMTRGQFRTGLDIARSNTPPATRN
jgi:hypothetical protein